MTQINGKFPSAYLGQPAYKKIDNIKNQGKY